QLLASLQDAEGGQRGYIITGDEAYLEPHTRGVAAVQQHHKKLTDLVADNPRQSARAEALRSLIGERLAALQEGIDLRRQKDFPAAQAHVLTGRGKRAMDSLRDVMQAMGDEEQRLLVERARLAAEARETSTLTILYGTLIALVIGGLAGFLITR